MKLFGVKIYVSGDHISPHESAVLVMNHRTRVDWNFLWAAMYQACMPSVGCHKLKFILKDPIRHIPGPGNVPNSMYAALKLFTKVYMYALLAHMSVTRASITGWIMQMNGFLYITRRWKEDRGRLSRALDYLIALDSRTQLLIFPEGTDLTKSSREKSDRYALQHHLPHYTYTLHPKTTGFAYLVQHFQRANYLDAVYDLTIAYPDYIPQSEIDLIMGRFPREVHFHIRRISSADIPAHDDSTLRRWLEDRWSDKEMILKRFYERKAFPTQIWPMAKTLPLRAAFGFWSILTGS